VLVRKRQSQLSCGIPIETSPPNGPPALVSALPDQAVGGAPARSRALRRQGKETLRRLFEGAIVVFDERGYNAARVDDIVKQAKTSHGTFYLYFANKEDLFQALIVGVTEQMRELAESLPSINPSRTGYEELRDWLGRFYDLYEHYHPVIRAWTEINSQNREMARRGAFVLRRFVDQLVRRVREIDPQPVSDPETAAMAMVSMVERSTFYAIVHMVPVTREALLDNLATILHVGLFGGQRRRKT
jgi:AcrR family transcriptional regulator